MGNLLYGGGLRLIEVLRLRVQDLDEDFNHIIVRNSKGQKDRVTLFPNIIKKRLREHLKEIKAQHIKDLTDGYGEVYLPFALEKKYPNVNKEWHWQYVFPSGNCQLIPDLV
jgi:integrase